MNDPSGLAFSALLRAEAQIEEVEDHANRLTAQLREVVAERDDLKARLVAMEAAATEHPPDPGERDCSAPCAEGEVTL